MSRKARVLSLSKSLNEGISPVCNAGVSFRDQGHQNSKADDGHPQHTIPVTSPSVQLPVSYP